jgi:hypothetical protein
VSVRAIARHFNNAIMSDTTDQRLGKLLATSRTAPVDAFSTNMAEQISRAYRATRTHIVIPKLNNNASIAIYYLLRAGIAESVEGVRVFKQMQRLPKTGKPHGINLGVDAVA